MWFESEFADLADAYCIALIEGRTPNDILRSLGGQPETTIQGIDNTLDAAYDATGQYTGYLALTTLGSWTLSIEPNGFICSLDDTANALSEGTRFVSHQMNINRVSRFLWMESGDTKASFELLYPDVRTGSDADRIATLVSDAGFAPADESDSAMVPAAFALAELLTGVVVTPEIFRSATFTCGTVPGPRSH